MRYDCSKMKYMYVYLFRKKRERMLFEIKSYFKLLYYLYRNFASYRDHDNYRFARFHLGRIIAREVDERTNRQVIVQYPVRTLCALFLLETTKAHIIYLNYIPIIIDTNDVIRIIKLPIKKFKTEKKYTPSCYYNQTV